jgi:Protein of unknown function (DUF2806)
VQDEGVDGRRCEGETKAGWPNRDKWFAMEMINLTVGLAAGTVVGGKLITAFFHAFGYDPASYKMIAEARARETVRDIEERGKLTRQTTERRWNQSVQHLAPSDAHNLTEVLKRAIPEISPDANPHDVQRDKLRYFAERAKLFSDADMQEIWARILAGEVNQPGSFSRRAMEAVSLLERTEAQSFEKLCQFCATAVTRQPHIVTRHDDVISQFGLSFDNLLALDAAGLIHMYQGGPFADTINTGYVEGRSASEDAKVRYFDRDLMLNLSHKTHHIHIGKVQFTSVGAQLCRICKASPDDRIFDYFVRMRCSLGELPYLRWPN